ncbi:MAG TPA: fasciclin domain-containing protein [Chryseosolibacter sp.]
MNLRFFSYMKHALMVSAMLAIVGISGCDDEDGPTVFNGTIMDLIKSDQYKQSVNGDDTKSLDSLVKYLEYHDLDVVVAGTGPITLFAPNNAAFKSLIATPGFPADIRKIDPNIVKGVLSYHVVADEVKKSEIASGASFSTAFTGTANNPNDKINVNSDGTLLTGSTNQAIVITESDKLATNGVVHVTGTVLIPQSVGASLTPILGTLAGSVFLGADFTTLVKMINKADAGVAAADQIRTLLATPAATETSSNLRRTFFAIPNAYFSAAAQAQGITVDQLLASFSATASRAILLNHFVTTNTANRNTYTVSDIAGSGDVQFTTGMQLTSNGGKVLTMVTGQTVSAQNPYGVVITAPKAAGGVSQVPIAVKDITHANGSVLHAVLGFIVP